MITYSRQHKLRKTRTSGRFHETRGKCRYHEGAEGRPKTVFEALFSFNRKNPKEDDMNILVIDGQGGRLGRKLVEGIRKICPQASITAVGTNSMATENMLNSGCADFLATGENAVIVACRTAQIIVGPFGIATADAMLGEISPTMANAVASSPAYRVLIPMNLCNTYVAGVTKGSAALLEDAMAHIQALAEREKNA